MYKVSISLPAEERKLQFIDSITHALKDGEYEIAVSTSLKGVPGYQDSDLTISNQYFAIDGPRFNIANDDIHAMYPTLPGIYGTDLPYILFNKKMLPWERAYDGGQDNTPWLTLLCLKAEELSKIADPISATMATTVNIKNWLTSPPQNTCLPQIDVRSLTGKENGQIIQISKDTFNQIFPAASDLPYLAHCRQISNENALTDDGTMDTGTVAVILANRFPLADNGNNQDTQYHAHLISLEGLKGYIKPNQLPDDAQYLQLVSLASWSFISHSMQTTHGQSFKQLITLMSEESRKHDQPLLQLPIPPNDQSPESVYAIAQISQGFVPLLYHLRSGDNTLAWYRGPLAPQPLQWPTGFPITSQTGSYAMILDASDAAGLFNCTYAGAWQLGRAMAIADAQMMQALLSFRSYYHQSVNRLLVKHEWQTNAQQSIKSAHTLQWHGMLKVPRSTQLVNRQKRLADLSQNPPAIDKSTQHYQQLRDWVIKLYQLQNIPFSYLIPDGDLLPDNTIRFFYFDQAWMQWLLDGALSVGLHTSRDVALNEQLKQALLAEINPMPRSGFFLRSPIISGWPQLRTSVLNNSNETILPMTTNNLGKNLICYLFADIPASVTISQPHQQLTFGVTGDEGDLMNGEIDLRSTEDGTKYSTVIEAKEYLNYLRSGQSIFNFATLEQNCLRLKLVAQKDPNVTASKPLTSSQLAIQLLNSPYQVQFTHQTLLGRS